MICFVIPEKPHTDEAWTNTVTKAKVIYSNQCFSYHNRVQILALFYHFAESGRSESAWHSSHGFQHIRGTCLEGRRDCISICLSLTKCLNPKKTLCVSVFGKYVLTVLRLCYVPRDHHFYGHPGGGRHLL